MSRRDHKELARNLAEVIDELYDVERTRERRIDLIAVHVFRAIRIGFKSKRVNLVDDQCNE